MHQRASLLPIYRAADVARFLGEPASTVRAWLRGSSSGGVTRFQPVIQPHDPTGERLSITNVFEVQMLAALLRAYDVPLQRVRKALKYVEQQLGVKRPLVAEVFHTDGLDLFVERAGNTINATRAGQLGIREIFASVLQRVERDEMQLPRRIFLPIDRERGDSAERRVLIDPTRSFGRPVVAPIFVQAEVLLDRHLAGESIELIARDYGCDPIVVQEGVRWASARASKAA